jgi:hypothetical protein
VTVPSEAIAAEHDQRVVVAGDVDVAAVGADGHTLGTVHADDSGSSTPLRFEESEPGLRSNGHSERESRDDSQYDRQRT